MYFVRFIDLKERRKNILLYFLENKAAEHRESDSDKQSDDDYDYTNVTNEDDYKIRKDIDEAQSSIKNVRIFIFLIWKLFYCLINWHFRYRWK